MKSICEFIPSKRDNGNLKTVHFVYETEYKRLKWPLVSPIYYLFFVTRGTGELKLPEFGTHPIKVGDLFAILPGVRYEISGSNDLSYLYISFMGTRAPELIEQIVFTMEKPVREGYTSLIPFWMQSLRRLDPQNSNLIAEAVLLYTFSYLTHKSVEQEIQKQNVIQSVLDYIDHNYRDPSLNLKKTADIFGYTDKYLSHLFKQHVHTNWSIYLNRLRIQQATSLIEKGESNIATLSSTCGFIDTFYFSKVFKKYTGRTPYNYIKSRK